MGTVFVSYRRQDTLGSTGRICEHLDRAGIDFFRDIDDIPPGRDFRVVIRDALPTAEVVLVVIGNKWLTVTDDKGARRLDSASDSHRLEIAAALRSDAVVIPVLVESATVPKAEDLPRDVKELAYINAWQISDRRFTEDVGQLIDQIRLAQHEVRTRRTAATHTEGERIEAERLAAEEASRRRAEAGKQREEVGARERQESETGLDKGPAAADYFESQPKPAPSAPKYRSLSAMERIGYGLAVIVPLLLSIIVLVQFTRFLFVDRRTGNDLKTWTDVGWAALGAVVLSLLAVGFGLWFAGRGKERRTAIHPGPSNQ